MIARLNLVARLMKWVILVDIILCILLYLPEQIREFYRITAASSLSGGVMLVVWMLVVGITVWVTADQVSVEAEQQLDQPPIRMMAALRLLPIVMGFAPIAATAIAQLRSAPEIPTATESMLQVGSILRIQANELASDATRLRITCYVLLATGLLVAAIEWLISRKTRRISRMLNDVYFSKPRALLVTAALIIAADVFFVSYPVGFPQAINVFGIIAIFSICICSFVVHVTLISDRHRVAVIPVVLAIVALLAAIGCNDNHLVRALQLDAKPANLPDIADDFATWLKRQDRAAYAKGSHPRVYPVFVVAAQGGGAYAAYNAATFLARMQDLCPAFRHHLFAISAVSGGSVGAASFAAALRSEDDAGRTEGLERANLSEPCPRLTMFLAKERAIDDLGKPGVLEAHVNSILRSDFLSPLVASALFPDFTQTFLPFPIPEFDRARALEYAFEAAGREIIEPRSDGTRPPGLLEGDYIRHWNAQRSIPALLFNATDAGTGKRAILSPFKLTATQTFSDEVCLVANSSDTERAEIDDSASPSAPTTLTELPMPLSTAAFISARFPWVTPAATITVKNPCFGADDTVRLVDGGYLDNSGVETALGLIERLKQVAKAARAQDGSVPEIGLHLISLTGGDFPTRSSYSFDDALEPIRALLSGRETRAYIALNRARTSMSDADNPTVSSFDRTDLRGMFYRLPLGWSLSAKTRDIISHESGRYWDCEPGLEYSQTRRFLSNSDCIQLHVNFLLKGTLPSALQDLKQTEAYKAEFNSQPAPKLDSESLLICYEKWLDERKEATWHAANDGSAKLRLTSLLNYQHQYLSFYQAEQVRDILREWDELDAIENNPNMLAFILGALSFDTQEFRRTSEFLSFDSVSSLEAVWGKRLKDIDKANQPHPPIDRTKLLNNPKELARVVWAGRYGNNSDDDTWNYRERGLFQIVGREQYRRFSGLIGYSLLNNPDAILDRRAAARVAFAHYLQSVNYRTGKKLADYVKQDPPDWRGGRENEPDGPNDAPAEVSERGQMFLGCIKQASSKISLPKGSLSKTAHN